MNWTEPTPPTPHISHYDHVTCETPLGSFMIEWKSWKENDSYIIAINGIHLGVEYTLEDAKNFVKQYLISRYEELTNFLSNDPTNF
jgi:hypothetical protein